ncbi:MAG: hypothetical protein WCK35_16475, partial [Chloroflexota bacterium]
MRTPINYLYLRISLIFTLVTMAISGCVTDYGPGPIEPSNLPAAETPVLETILDTDHQHLVPYHASGVYEMSPGASFELRLRAIWPSNIQIKIDDQLLPEVKDSSSHPDLDSTGYFRISDPILVTSTDSRYFWRVYVALPLDKREIANFSLSVIDTSQNLNLSGLEKEAAPLQISIVRPPIL